MEWAKHLEQLIKWNDEWTRDGIARQDLNEQSRFYGGIIETYTGIASPSHGGTPMTMSVWTVALLHPLSEYYQNSDLIQRLELAAAFNLRMQHTDGTISPPWTNLHSPPDTAFVVSGLAQVYELLVADTSGLYVHAAELIRTFLERTVPALLTGGCHTPNHRWVLLAAIGFMYKLTGKEELLERAEQWLAEGMDCTQDGEWTERSNGIYNAVSDLVLIYAAEQLERPELLEPVRRNLHMMRYMVQPDGYVVTDYSGRQDFGGLHPMSSYFIAARLMAELDGDQELAALADLAAQHISDPGMLPNNALIGILRYPQLREPKVKAAPFPDNYHLFLHRDFPRASYLAKMSEAGHGGTIYHSRLHPEFGAPLARIRRGESSATIMTEATSFFALQKGGLRLLATQLASSFGPGFIQLQEMVPVERQNAQEQHGNDCASYMLTGVEKKGYYAPVAKADLPLTAAEAVSPWYLLPHHLREVTHEQTQRIKVKVEERAQGLWHLHVSCPVQEVVLTQLMLIFHADTTLTGSGLVQRSDSHFAWESGEVIADCAGKQMTISVSGVDSKHSTFSLNNAGHPAGTKQLVLNVLTPYDFTVELQLMD